MPENDFDKCVITHYPADVLASEAVDIENIDEDIKKLVDIMTDIMFENKGMGLAGPQAGVNLRIFIISLDGTREHIKVYINPDIETSGSLITNEEGCLSVPGLYTNIKRYEKCTVTALDLNGSPFTEHAEGLHARCLQHEYDHLQGITVVNRMGSAARIVHRRHIKKLEQAKTDK